MVTSVPIPPQEGIGFYVWNLTHFLVGQGHQVQIITRGCKEKPYYEVREEIPIWRPHFYPIYPFHVYLHGRYVQHLVKHMDREIDLFHFHTPLPPPICTQRPILLTIHSLMMPDAFGRRIEGFYDLLTKLQSPICYLLEKQMLQASRKVTAVSPPVAKEAQTRLNHNRCGVQTMWNGVDSSFFSPANQIQPDPTELLFVGRLAPGKGLQDLIQAFRLVLAQFPDVKLSIVGDGPLHQMVSALIDQNGLNNQVRLVGHVSSRETLRTLYQQAWALILSSHHESLPNVILEAMSCGTPVIATRVGGIPAVIIDCENGLLVNPHTPEKIAEAICRLHKDADLRNRLGQNARQTVEERFSWPVVGGNYLSCYRELLA